MARPELTDQRDAGFLGFIVGARPPDRCCRFLPAPLARAQNAAASGTWRGRCGQLGFGVFNDNEQGSVARKGDDTAEKNRSSERRTVEVLNCWRRGGGTGSIAAFWGWAVVPPGRPFGSISNEVVHGPWSIGWMSAFYMRERVNFRDFLFKLFRSPELFITSQPPPPSPLRSCVCDLFWCV